MEEDTTSKPPMANVSKIPGEENDLQHVAKCKRSPGESNLPTMTSIKLPSGQPCKPSDPVSANMGQATVEYRYLHDRTLWGTIRPGTYDEPACVIFADLTVSMPENAQLQNVTVTVTLQDDMHVHRRAVPWVHRVFPIGCAHCMYGSDFSSLHFSSHGPTALGYADPSPTGNKHDRGPRWTLRTDKYESLGALMWNNLKMSLDYSAVPTKGYRHVIHTAFVVEHYANTFVINTKIAATPMSTLDRVKNKLSGAHKADNTAITRFEFPDDAWSGYADRFPLDLEGICRNIAQGMEHVNMRSRPKWQPQPGFPVEEFLASIGDTKEAGEDAESGSISSDSDDNVDGGKGKAVKMIKGKI
ncbi:hypothetical protein B0T22DRAFT_460763 [Podospora appendiculata]|uniref:Uncharacterized protein n=1 Tax=Podospora appendiculata TaxID=314037 RepID=A0AAE0XAI1_9PEZI|nr:hypothetical protein B0T22DRAFT_460763 [Podospora appendiculata]